MDPVTAVERMTPLAWCPRFRVAEGELTWDIAE
jgi:hypothetical protein